MSYWNINSVVAGLLFRAWHILSRISLWRWCFLLKFAKSLTQAWHRLINDPTTPGSENSIKIILKACNSKQHSNVNNPHPIYCYFIVFFFSFYIFLWLIIPMSRTIITRTSDFLLTSYWNSNIHKFYSLHSHCHPLQSH